jgi:hypothetical protein
MDYVYQRNGVHSSRNHDATITYVDSHLLLVPCKYRSMLPEFQCSGQLAVQVSSLNCNPLTLGVVHPGITPSVDVPYKLFVIWSVRAALKVQIVGAVELHFRDRMECRKSNVKG